MTAYRFTLLSKKHKNETTVYTTMKSRQAAFEVLSETDPVTAFLKKHPKSYGLIEVQVNGRWLPIWANPSIEMYSLRLHAHNKRAKRQ